MRIAVMITVCEGEYDIGLEAIESLAMSCADSRIDLYLIDDASPSGVGNRLAREFQSRGWRAQCQTLQSALGFRGCALRFFTLLNRVAESGVDYDLALKLDPDALFIRAGFDRILLGCLHQPGIWGLRRAMRLKDRIPLLLDLLPVGLRRKKSGTIIQKGWEPRRIQPVWWHRFGLRALGRGYRFRYVPGSMIVIAGRTLAAARAAGYLRLPRDPVHGFLTSEDDVLFSLMVTALGHKIFDLRDQAADCGDVSIPTEAQVEYLRARGLYFVHPVKKTAAGQRLRQALGRLPARKGNRP